jgi:predicted amidohydrolase YtcJ
MAQTEKADFVLVSNAVFTGLNNAPQPASVVVKGNKIMDVLTGGLDHAAGLLGTDTKIYNFGDKLIMPGFMDAHVHFFMGAFVASEHMNTEISKSSSEEDCVRIMVDYSKQHPDLPRVCGMGWFPANWNDAPLPTKTSLDAAFPDKPAYLICADAHTAWLNSKALDECGITSETIVECGEICKDNQGQPNGILKEMAGFIAFGKMMNLPTNEIKAMQEAFLKSVISNGITSIGDMSAYELNDDTIGLFEAGKELERDDKLPVRLHLYPALGTNPDYENIKKYKETFDSEKILIAGLKGFVDGVTSTYTGLLLEPYTDKSGTNGHANYSSEVYEKCITMANAAGLGVRLHCIADGSVRLALDCFESSNRANGNTENYQGIPNTIEHCENVHPDDIPRFHDLGVIPSMQPYHLTLDNNEKAGRIGIERCKYEWPHKSLLEAGARLAFGSDYPVVGFNPFAGIYAAITRCDDQEIPTGVNPDQKISLAEALRAYTLGSAYAYGRQKDLGTLEKGKLADIIVVNNNPFKIEIDEIKNCYADVVFMDGKMEYDREDFRTVAE